MANRKHFTPTAAELKPFHQIKCQQPNCDAVFMNAGNYKLHLEKRHQIQNENNAATKQATDCYYYCPADACIYNFTKELDGGGRHFKHIKNLRQHFQKVHSKNFICERCGDAFPTDSQLTKHAQNSCGKRYKCLTCDWDFRSMEALLTHGKRKGHTVTEAKASKISKNAKQKDQGYDKETQTSFETPVINVLVQHNDNETQTEQRYRNLMAMLSDNETQTEFESYGNQSHNVRHDIETQTEQLTSNHSSTFFDQLWRQSTTTTTAAAAGADMHTQTSEGYYLSHFGGLSDIQTQTNWSAFKEQEQQHNMFRHTTSTATSTAGFSCDELLVSTETQTSFTQCLLESSDMSCGNVVGGQSSHAAGVGVGEESTNTFHFYTTQHTQTCDVLFNGLFGGQEQDLIANFQSTYTQT